MTAPAIIVVGSLHYDIFVEAPRRPATGETVSGHSWTPKFGGKGGNQAVALAEAGIDVRMVSAVGTDTSGAYLLDRLGRAGISTDFVSILAEAPSGMSVAISEASGDYSAVIVSGANLLIPQNRLCDDALWAGAEFLVLQSEVPAALNLAAAREAVARDVPVCLNAAPWRPICDGLVDTLDLIVLNALEAAAMTGVKVDDLTGASAACDIIGARVPSVVVTVGAAGVAWRAEGRTGAIMGEIVDVVSTHGAGDHFIGSLIAGLVAGRDLEGAARAANASAARFVSDAASSHEL